jgi:hypothetical protein
MKRKLLIQLAALAMCGVFTGCETGPMAGAPDPVRRVAFDGKSLEGWRQPAGTWAAVGDIELSADDPKRFTSEPGFGVLLNSPDGSPTVNLVSAFEHGDVQAHVEFCVPKGSNSGVYFQGRYEIQVFDSWGVESPQHSDCGGIYQRWQDDRGFEGHAPRVNASKPPGEWQRFDVIFRAPRYDDFGNKTENAKFVSVKQNGVLVHENVTLTGPTRAALDETTEVAFGPLMLQGDHGPVAYRNIVIREIMLD